MELKTWAEKFNPKKEILNWRCLACDEVFEGIYPPEICTVCGASFEMFEVFQEEKTAFHLDRKVKVTIIGAGAAGLAAAEAIKMRNKDAEVTIISNEAYSPYYRPAVSALITENIYNKMPKSLFLKDQDWYSKNNINLMLDTKIKVLDTQRQEIHLSTDKKIVYDKLIIATGAKPFVPPIKGVEKQFENVVTCNTIDDVKTIRKLIDNHKIKNVVVCGGGVLGLENAWSMHRLGMNVTIVEIADYLLPMQLDKKSSDAFKKLLEMKKVKFITNAGASEIKGDGKMADAIKLSNDEELDVDLVILSCGVRRNTEFLNNNIINVNRGILVNEKMETNVPNVYACGDVSELENNPVKMLWSPAIAQGKVAGANCCGENISYEISDYPMTIMIFNNTLVSVGNINELQEKLAELEFVDKNICEDNFSRFAFSKDSGVVWGVSVNNNEMQIIALGSTKSDITTYANIKKQAN